MSTLSVIAMQVCAVQSLNGKVQASVYDSSVDLRDLETGPAPVVVVYSASGRRRVQGRELFDSHHKVDFVLDIGISHKVTRTFSDGTTTHTAEFQATDAAFDALLHSINYECSKRLFACNDKWPDLFRRFIFSFSEEESDWARGQLAEGGRQALLRQTYSLDVMGDPVPGAPLSELWADFLTAMSEDPELADMGKYWTSLITDPELPMWRQEQVRFGLTFKDIFALGNAPPLYEVSDPPTQEEAADEQQVTSEEISIKSDDLAVITGDDEKVTISGVTIREEDEQD